MSPRGWAVDARPTRTAAARMRAARVAAAAGAIAVAATVADATLARAVGTHACAVAAVLSWRTTLAVILLAHAHVRAATIAALARRLAVPVVLPLAVAPLLASTRPDTAYVAATVGGPTSALLAAGDVASDVLLAPLCEELLFRWLPLRWLTRGAVRAGALGRPAWAALAALQVAFALCHLPRLADAAGGDGRELARPLAELAAAGGVLAALAVATRSLAAPLALHVALNALVVARPPALTRAHWWAALLGGAVALAAVIAVARARGQGACASARRSASRRASSSAISDALRVP